MQNAWENVARNFAAADHAPCANTSLIRWMSGRCILGFEFNDQEIIAGSIGSGGVEERRSGGVEEWSSGAVGEKNLL